MSKGFTLIELLIVIAIVAVLAVAVVLVLNPAELIKQGRDSTRISDFGVVNSAVAYVMSVSSTPAIFDAQSRCTLTGGGNPCSAYCPFTTDGTCVGFADATVARNINGTGWIGIKLDGVTPGPPLANLPIDPVNSGTSTAYYFSGDASLLTFEIDGTLESTKFLPMAVNDGGNNTGLYEVGTDSGLNL